MPNQANIIMHKQNYAQIKKAGVDITEENYVTYKLIPSLPTLEGQDIDPA